MGSSARITASGTKALQYWQSLWEETQAAGRAFFKADAYTQAAYSTAHTGPETAETAAAPSNTNTGKQAIKQMKGVGRSRRRDREDLGSCSLRRPLSDKRSIDSAR